MIWTQSGATGGDMDVPNGNLGGDMDAPSSDTDRPNENLGERY